ncbi:MAG: MFS transporter [Deltaproteobacteria bacterium]|jgi:sugar phosphate permease|nr:MFS transporter [Deltaproteobacteria bacterium]
MANNIRAKIVRFRWLIFIVLALAYFFVYFHRLSLSVVANDLIEDFKTTASVMGLLGSIYFYCYAFMQFPAGLLSDSLGPRKSVTFFLIIASLGSLLFGFSPTIEVAFVGRVMVGMGVSMVFIPTMKIFSRWFRPHEFAFMTGILNAVGGMGVLAATWLLAVMTLLLGWRVSFELIGCCTFIIVVLVWFIVRDRPEDKGWPSIEELDKKSTDKVFQPTQQIPLLEGARQVISEKYFWPVAIWFFFDCGVFFAFGGLWGGPYLMHVYGMTRAQAGTVLSMIAWGMIIGSPPLGFLSDKVMKSRKKPFILCNLVLVAELVFLSIYPTGLPHFALYILFFIFSICSSSVVIFAFTNIKELFPTEIAGTSTGMVNLFPFLGGAVFMPLLGWVLDAYPKSDTGGYSLEAYSMLIFILLGAAVISLICTFLTKETYQDQ